MREEALDTHAMEECQEGDDEYRGDEYQWSGAFAIMDVAGEMTDVFWNHPDMHTRQGMGVIDSGACASVCGLSWLARLRGANDISDLSKSDKMFRFVGGME